MHIHLSQEFKVTQPDGTLYPTEEFHQLGVQLMDALIDLEDRSADFADSTTSSDASSGTVTVEVLVSAEHEFAARLRFTEVVSAAKSAAGRTGSADRLTELREAAASRVQTMPMFDDHPDDIRQRDEEREAWLTLQALRPDPSEIEVWEPTEAEWATYVAKVLNELGLTYEELAQQARNRDFQSTDARNYWIIIGESIERQASRS